jgi:phosphatidyl-myo-inositol dimannoside synthase
MRPDILYVTRKFPPSVGGMENLAFEIATSIRRAANPRVIALRRGQRNLVWFLPYAALRTLVVLVLERIPTVLVGDPVVMVALWPVLALHRRTRVAVVVHGLDLTLPIRPYRVLVRRALRRADLVIAISEATKREAVALGVAAERIDIVLPGLPVPRTRPDVTDARARIRARFGLGPDDVVVATVGRLVPRKGQAWFAREVLPLLPEQYRYLVAGDGPDREAIRAAADASGVADRCVLVGAVDGGDCEAILSGADVFVVPNISVPGDMEGFGLVAAEASLRGTPVVAARVQGLTDAVIEGVTGVTCDPGDAHGFATAIRAIADRAGDLDDRDAVAAASAAQFGTARLDVDLVRVLGLAASSAQPDRNKRHNSARRVGRL